MAFSVTAFFPDSKEKKPEREKKKARGGAKEAKAVFGAQKNGSVTAAKGVVELHKSVTQQERERFLLLLILLCGGKNPKNQRPSKSPLTHLILFFLIRELGGWFCAYFAVETGLNTPLPVDF